MTAPSVTQYTRIVYPITLFGPNVGPLANNHFVTGLVHQSESDQSEQEWRKNAHDATTDIVAPIVPVAFALLPNLDDLLVE